MRRISTGLGLAMLMAFHVHAAESVGYRILSDDENCQIYGWCREADRPRPIDGYVITPEGNGPGC